MRGQVPAIIGGVAGGLAGLALCSYCAMSANAKDEDIENLADGPQKKGLQRKLTRQTRAPHPARAWLKEGGRW